MVGETEDNVNERVEGDNNEQGASLSQQSFQIRPHLEQKFRPMVVKETILSVLSDHLAGKKYNADEAATLSKEIANTVRDKVKALEFPRYKIMVQVVLGEQRGAGVKMGARCLWDADADSYASADFISVSEY